ncbi:hypothetical protein OEZ86_008771 [Tetradesmus obliquus]|nr:hypothetical protein OEZ86_008771 [Tetradesmus obliquus]
MSRASSSWLEYPVEDNAALGEVIGQLVLLTRLEVSVDVDGRALAAASNLQQLQELRIAHELSMLWADGGMGPSEMQQLLTLSKLTRLGVAGCDWDDEAAERALAQLTGLQELRIMAASKLTAGGLACLTALKRLSYLAVWGSKLSFSDISSSTTGSSNSDSEDDSTAQKYQGVTLTNRDSFLPVQLQLLKKCRSSFQGLSVMWAGVGSGEMGHLKTLSKLTKLGVGGWLRELRMTAASKLTAGGLACLTALSQLTRLAVWGSNISLGKNYSNDDNSGSESDSDSEEPEYQDVTLTNEGCVLPVYLELRDKCSSSFQGLAMMCKHAQEQAAQTAFELSQKEEALQYHLSHLAAVKRELVDTRQELAAAQQQLQQQGQQLQQQGSSCRNCGSCGG